MPLRRYSLIQRLADDVYPALRLELDNDPGDVGLHSSPGQEHATGNVRRRVAPGDQGGDLHLGGGQRRPPDGRAWSAAGAGASPDTVRAQPTLGPPDVP